MSWDQLSTGSEIFLLDTYTVNYTYYADQIESVKQMIKFRQVPSCSMEPFECRSETVKDVSSEKVVRVFHINRMDIVQVKLNAWSAEGNFENIYFSVECLFFKLVVPILGFEDNQRWNIYVPVECLLSKSKLMVPIVGFEDNWLRKVGLL